MIHAWEPNAVSASSPRKAAATPRPIFDAHLHLINPRFPLEANRGFVPDAFTAEAYRRRVAGLGVVGGAVVAGSFHGIGQEHLLDALGQLGPGFVGVAQLPPDFADDDVRTLDAAGVRAVRVNLRRGGRDQLASLDRVARRVFELAGWHVEVYADGRELEELEPLLGRLPRVSVDHLGMHRDGLAALVRLAGGGARVKASGFGRVELDVRHALAAVAEANPEALMFGTDLPGTRAPRPFARADLALVEEVLGPDLAARVLYDNAVSWYRPDRGAST